MMSEQQNTTVAIVGCGKGGEGVGGHSIGYLHANHYTDSGYTIVGACDLNPENLDRFAKHYHVPHASKDLATMLEAAKPGIVSICTYAGSHLPIFEQCIASGVKAIFMEKPLCLTMADGIKMLELAETNNVKVVVNHFRRYLTRFKEAKKLLDDGVIGNAVCYMAGINGWDLMEWGTHWLDMFRFFANDQDVEWVLGQAEVSDKKGYGHVMEDHALAYFGFSDGSKGLLDGGKDFIGEAAIRIIGTEGMMNIPIFDAASYVNAEGITEFAEGTNIHEDENAGWKELLEHFAAWRDDGPTPQCCLSNALKSSELYLAAYESAVQRGRITPPLDSTHDRFPLNQLSKNK